MSGSAAFTNDSATGVGLGGFFDPASNTGGSCAPFTLNTSGDTGWSPAPICNIPAKSPLWVYPDVVTFPPGGSNMASVAIVNKAYETATLGAITTSTGFTVNSSACGASLASAAYGSGPGGKCLLSVTFNGSTTGTTLGTLTIPNSESGTPTVVHLIAGSGSLVNCSSCIPQPPTAPTLSDSSASGSIVLNWTASTGGTPISYNVYRGTTSGGETLLSSGTGVTGTTFTDTTAAYPNTYYYYVKAVNPYGASSASNEISSSMPPPTPANLAGTGREGSITLTWTASATGSQPISYNVYRGTTAGGEGSTPINSAPLTATSYTDISVSNGGIYYYRVAAVNTGGASAESGEVRVSTPTVLLQIDAGNAAPIGSYAADEYFNTGNDFSTAATVSTAGVTSPAPESVYQSVRWASSFAYTIPGLTPGAAYMVRLHFAELTWTAAGQRVFNVAINGQAALSNFDVFAAAGGQLKAVVKEFSTTATSAGQIAISFTQGSADNPEIAGIEILGTGSITPPPSVVQIDTGSNTAVGSFSADQGFNAGNEFSSTAAIDVSLVSNPAPQAVYQTCRWASSFTYTIPGLTANKSYTVRLHFAELTWNAAGQRKFNVAINGANVLTGFDIFAAAGAQNRAVVEQFPVVASSSGTITIAFTQGGADNPEVNGVEIQ